MSAESLVMRVYSSADDDDDLEDFCLLNYTPLVNTSIIETIDIHQFIEFIFVIHSSSFTSHTYNLEGMRNVFYITEIIPPSPASFRFSSLLFQSILMIQKIIASILNKSTQFQVCRGANKLPLNSYVWEYISPKLGDITSKIGSRTEKIYLSNLTKMSKKTKVEIQSLYLDSPEAFTRMKAMFGKYTCTGSRVRFPRLAIGQLPLTNGDTLNVLDNIKFIFIKKYSELTIKCTYHRVVLHNNNVTF